MATEASGKFTVIGSEATLILTELVEPESFNNTTTVFPAGVLYTTFGKYDEVLDSILTDPGGTNFDECPIT